jgi:Zn-dependent protease
MAINLRQIYLGKILGVPVRAHYSWLPVFPVYAYAISSALLPRNAPGLPAWEYWSLGLITTALLFGSVLLHELAHSVMARVEGIGAPGITLYFFGGFSSLGSQPASPATEFKVAVVGPAASFIIGTVFFAVDQLLFRHTTHLAASQVFRHLGIVNWLLAGFNILPGLPLDGGRVLRAAVWRFNKNFREATRVAVRAGLTISFALIVSGVYFLPRDLVTSMWCLTIGVLLVLMLVSSRRAPAGRRPKPGSVEEVMTREVVVVSPDIRVQEFVDGVLRNNHFTSFPVGVNRRLHGMLLLQELKQVPRERWSDLTAAQVMRPVDDSMFVAAAVPVAEARARLASNGLGRAVVLDSNGLIVGYVSLRDIDQDLAKSMWTPWSKKTGAGSNRR